MNKKLLLFIVLIIIVVLILFSFKINNKSSLVNPAGLKPVSSASPVPTPTNAVPQTFKFDKTTDLKKELEKVDPQVLESDFQ